MSTVAGREEHRPGAVAEPEAPGMDPGGQRESPTGGGVREGALMDRGGGDGARTESGGRDGSRTDRGGRDGSRTDRGGRNGSGPDRHVRREARRKRLLRIRALVKKEMRQLFRDPRTKRIVFGAPILQVLLFGYAVTTDVRDVATFVVDHDQTAASRALQDAITASGHFRIVGRSDRSGALGEALDAGRAAVGVEIPRGFAADLAAGHGARVQILVDGTNSNTATVAQGYINRIVQSHGVREAARRGVDVPAGVELHARAWFNPDLTSRAYNVPAVIGVLLMLMSLLLTALAVVREREQGTLEQLEMTPLTPGEFILGKTIPVALIAFVDLVLVMAVAIFWFDVPFRGSALALFVASAIYILASLGAGLLISSISRTQQEAFMGMFLLFLPLVILSGFMYPIQSMPVFFQRLTLLNPVRHFLEVVRAVFLKGAGLGEVWPQVVVLAGVAVAVIWLAALSGPRFTFQTSPRVARKTGQ